MTIEELLKEKTKDPRSGGCSVHTHAHERLDDMPPESLRLKDSGPVIDAGRQEMQVAWVATILLTAQTRPLARFVEGRIHPDENAGT